MFFFCTNVIEFTLCCFPSSVLDNLTLSWTSLFKKVFLCMSVLVLPVRFIKNSCSACLFYVCVSWHKWEMVIVYPVLRLIIPSYPCVWGSTSRLRKRAWFDICTVTSLPVKHATEDLQSGRLTCRTGVLGHVTCTGPFSSRCYGSDLLRPSAHAKPCSTRKTNNTTSD